MRRYDRLDRWYDRVLRLIRNRQQMTGTELAQATQGLTEFERHDIIDHWVAIGEIAKEVIRPKFGSPGGRPKTIYRYVPLIEQAGVESVKEYDVSKMACDEIEAANERRNALNAILIDEGLYPMELLPMPTGS